MLNKTETGGFGIRSQATILRKRHLASFSPHLLELRLSGHGPRRVPAEGKFTQRKRKGIFLHLFIARDQQTSFLTLYQNITCFSEICEFSYCLELKSRTVRKGNLAVSIKNQGRIPNPCRRIPNPVCPRSSPLIGLSSCSYEFSTGSRHTEPTGSPVQRLRCMHELLPEKCH